MSVIRSIRPFLAIGLLALLVSIIVRFIGQDNAGSLIQFVQAKQRAFHDSMGHDLQTVHDQSSIHAFAGLIVTGFLYGILHAAGPGHGKIVITSYMLANERSLKRGLVITFLSSMMQAVVAVILVVGLFKIFGLTRQRSEYIANWFEIFSYGIVAFLGLVLIWRGLKESRFFRYHKHSDDGSCCGGHAPAPQTMERRQSFAEWVMIIVSIGIRPCSGALLLLAFAMIIGAVWAGVIATFVMALGTAITTAFLAIIAVQSKSLALRFLKLSDRKFAAMESGIKLTGGFFLVAISLLFLISAATMQVKTESFTAHPLMGGRIP